MNHQLLLKQLALKIARHYPHCIDCVPSDTMPNVWYLDFKTTKGTRTISLQFTENHLLVVFNVTLEALPIYFLEIDHDVMKELVYQILHHHKPEIF